MAIEFPLYHSEQRTWVLAEQVLLHDLEYLLHEKARYALRLLFGMSPLEVVRTHGQRVIPWGSPLARAETVSKWGDETLAVSKYQAPGIREWLRRHEAAGTWPAAEPPESLRRFFEWARANGVHVALAWIPLLEHDDYRSPDHAAYFRSVQAWYTRAGFDSLGEATAYFRPLDEMFDTIKHPNETGRINATEVMARAFCKVRRCTPTPTAIKK